MNLNTYELLYASITSSLFEIIDENSSTVYTDVLINDAQNTPITSPRSKPKSLSHFVNIGTLSFLSFLIKAPDTTMTATKITTNAKIPANAPAV